MSGAAQLWGLAAAHLQAGWNRTSRESGVAGRAAAAVVVVFVLLALVPVGGLGAALGWGLGRELGALPAERAVRALAVIHLGAALAFGALAGVRAGPSIADEGLRVFPLREGVLLVMELLGHAADLMLLMAGAFFLGLGAGVAVRHPLLAPAVLHVALHGALWAMLLALLLGDLKRALFKRIPLRLLLPGGAAALAGLWALARFGPARAALQEAGGRAALLSPPGLAWAGAGELARGHLWSGLWPQLVLLAATALLAGLAALAHAAERRLEARAARPADREAEVFSFRTPVQGVARLFLWQVWTSRYGKLLYLSQLPLSLSAVFLLRVLPAQGKASGEAMQAALAKLPSGTSLLVVYVLYGLLNSSGLLYNQFAFDRAGVRTLLLLPVTPADLARGKLRGHALFALLQFLIGAPPLLLLGLPDAASLLRAAASGGLVFLLLFAPGFFFSVRFPRKVAYAAEGEAASSTPLAVSLALLAQVAAAIALAWSLDRLGGRFAAPLLLAAFALAALATARLMPALGRALDRHRERLVQELA